MNRFTTEEFIERRSQQLYKEVQGAVDSVQKNLSQRLIRLNNSRILTKRPCRELSIGEVAQQTLLKLEQKS